MQKCNVIGVKSIDWFKSYPSNRKQIVYVNTNSKVCVVMCGVPKGSVLEPLLFLIYANDLQSCINQECKVSLYTNDTSMFVYQRSRCYLENTFSSWLFGNTLYLHLGKTESILFWL